MLMIFEELINDTSINLGTVVLKMVVSLILGIILGSERQWRRRDAGLRTFTLICTGSTAAMLISIWIPQIYPDFLNGDPGRIAAQILTGIGFLGAGAIARGKGSVQGLTTAACIWVAAVIGMAVGAGLYAGALIVTVMTLFVLISVEKVEQRLLIGGANRMLVVHCKTDDPDVEKLIEVINESNICVGSYTYSSDFEANESNITFRVSVTPQASLQVLFRKLKSFDFVSSANMMA